MESFAKVSSCMGILGAFPDAKFMESLAKEQMMGSLFLLSFPSHMLLNILSNMTHKAFAQVVLYAHLH